MLTHLGRACLQGRAHAGLFEAPSDTGKCTWDQGGREPDLEADTLISPAAFSVSCQEAFQDSRGEPTPSPCTQGQGPGVGLWGVVLG